MCANGLPIPVQSPLLTFLELFMLKINTLVSKLLTANLTKLPVILSAGHPKSDHCQAQNSGQQTVWKKGHLIALSGKIYFAFCTLFVF